MAAPILLVFVSIFLSCRLGAGEVAESFYEDGASSEYLGNERNDEVMDVVASRGQNGYQKDEGQRETARVGISSEDEEGSMRRKVRNVRTNRRSIEDSSVFDKRSLEFGKRSPLFGRESSILRSYTPVVIRGSRGITLLRRNNPPTFNRYRSFQIFGKDIPALGKDVVALKISNPALGEDDSILRRDSSVHEKSGPFFGKDSPVFGKDSPLFGKDHPFLGKDSPLFGKDSPALGKDSPLFGKDSQVLGKDSPLFGKDSPALGKNSPLFGKDSPVLGKDGPLFGKDGLLHGKDNPLFGKDSPVLGKDGPFFGKDNPFFGKNGRILGKDNPFFGKSGRILGKDSSILTEGSNINDSAKRYRLKANERREKSDLKMSTAEKTDHAFREDHPMFGRELNRDNPALLFGDVKESHHVKSDGRGIKKRSVVFVANRH